MMSTRIRPLLSFTIVFSTDDDKDDKNQVEIDDHFALVITHANSTWLNQVEIDDHFALAIIPANTDPRQRRSSRLVLRGKQQYAEEIKTPISKTAPKQGRSWAARATRKVNCDDGITFSLKHSVLHTTHEQFEPFIFSLCFP